MKIPEGRLPWGETYAENAARGIEEGKRADAVRELAAKQAEVETLVRRDRWRHPIRTWQRRRLWRRIVRNSRTSWRPNRSSSS